MTDAGWINLESSADGFALSAWHVPHQGERKGGLVVIQEIFGVTEDLKRVCATFASEGYEVLSPSLFDRREPRVQINRTLELDKARDFAMNNPIPQVLADLQACIDWLTPSGKVFMTGFCYGGLLTWLSAANCTGLSAGSGFYGGRIANSAKLENKCPVILHFGRNDSHIPMEQVEEFTAARPDIPVHIYEAGHGFVSEDYAGYDAESTKLAMQRTLDLFAANG